MNNTSMFIPFVSASVDVDQITYVIGTVHDLGVVGKIDLVSRTDRTGVKFNMAYVHMIEWNLCSQNTQTFLANLTNTNRPVRLNVSNTEYWTVLENKYENKKILNAPKKAKKAKKEFVACLDFEIEEELVDATYVWQIEAELAKALQRIRELENGQVAVMV